MTIPILFNFRKSCNAWLSDLNAQVSIGRKIGLGYFIAIGLGFSGTIAGLLIADYFQGQGIKQLADAQQQSQLIDQLQISGKQVQYSGLHLAAFVEQPAQFQVERDRLNTSLDRVQILSQQLDDFIADTPDWLAADAEAMQTILNSYVSDLEEYTAQVESIAQDIEFITRSAPITATEAPGGLSRSILSSLEQDLLALSRTDLAFDLEQSQNDVISLLQVAQMQELEAGNAMEFAQGLEKLIIVVSALISVAIAGVIALQTTRAILRPLRQVQTIAHRMTQEEDFSIRLDVSGKDEVADLAHSFNQLVAWIENYIQELNQTLADLKQAQSQLVHSEKMSSLGQMVAGIAHEINNPVNYVVGNLEYANAYTEKLLQLQALYQKHFPQPPEEINAALREMDIEFLRKDFPQLLASLKIGTERIYDIVTSLRRFSRLDEADYKVVDVHEAIDTTLVLLQHRLKEQGSRPAIEIKKHYGHLPPIECYPGPINQVFMNLLVNAIDAIEDTLNTNTDKSSSKSSSIGTITIHTALQNDAWVRVKIMDTGCGIPDSIKTRIFDPFFTTKPVGTGTGMGLSICYQIVHELHSGHLEYLSSPREGTCFEIYLPLIQSLKKDLSEAKSSVCIKH
ncbi:MAG: ATP-binding protein [Cyanobacteria bacterium J06633_2]